MELKPLMEYTAAYFGLSLDDLQSRSRKRELVEPKHILRKYAFMKSAKIDTKNKNFSLSKISAITGSINHATSLSSIKMVNGLIQTDKNFAKKWADFKKYADKYSYDQDTTLRNLSEKI